MSKLDARNEPGLHLFTSNRLETLAAKLAGRLNRPLPSPFQPEIIVVRNKGMERWLKLELARLHGVCANCVFPFPEAFGRRIFREFDPDLPEELVAPLVGFKLSLVGLPPDTGAKMPAQLSGGMRKRAALARALALEPEILFLDEPTSGLDPVGARAFDRLVRVLCDSLGLTVVIVTHDLDTLLSVIDRAIVLASGKVIADGPVEAVRRADDAWIRDYFAARA